MTTKRVAVRLVAEGGRQVRAEFDGVGESGKKAFGDIERQADMTGTAIRRVAGILGAAFSVRELVRYADTWTDLRSRVDLTTGAQEAGAVVMERLSDMARRTYSSLELTAEGWLRNANALRELGLTTRESLDFTEAMNNAMVVSGAKGQRAEIVMNALSRAMGVGALRGNDLNTVMSNGGRVTELLAEHLGTTTLGLRALAREGKITSQVVVEALTGSLETLREEADRMPATIGDAFMIMGNAALRLVGTWDQLLGASNAVAQGIILLADNIERLAAVAIAAAALFAGRWVVAFVAARVATLSLAGALTLLRAAIIRTGIGALIVGAGELVYWFGQLVKGAGGFGEALELLRKVAAEAFERIGDVSEAAQRTMIAGAYSVRSAYLSAFAAIVRGASDMVRSVADLFNESMAQMLDGPMFEALDHAPDFVRSAVDRINSAFRIKPPRIEVAEGLGSDAIADLENRAKNAAQVVEDEMWLARNAIEHATRPLESLEALRGSVGDVDDALDRAAAGAGAFGEALEQAGRAAGRAGGAARGAGAAAEKAGTEAATAAAEAATGWAKAAETLDDYAARARDAAAAIGDATLNAFRGAEEAMARFVETGKLGVRDMVSSIIADLARLATRNLILGPLASAVSGIFSGLAARAGPRLGAAVLHGGGIVGAGAPQRLVPALAFADAPRLHSGGIAGLRADEVPAILQRGERVLSRRDAQSYGGAHGGGVVVNIDARGAVEGVASQIEAAFRARMPEIRQIAMGAVRDGRARGRPI